MGWIRVAFIMVEFIKMNKWSFRKGRKKKLKSKFLPFAKLLLAQNYLVLEGVSRAQTIEPSPEKEVAISSLGKAVKQKLSPVINDCMTSFTPAKEKGHEFKFKVVPMMSFPMKTLKDRKINFPEDTPERVRVHLNLKISTHGPPVWFWR